MSVVPEYDREPPARSRQRWQTALMVGIPIALLLVIASPFILFFGAIVLRDLGPTPSLKKHLVSDFNLLPVTPFIEVQNFGVKGGMDPLAYYELSIKPESVSAFVSELRTAARSKGWTIQEDLQGATPAPVPNTPLWFQPVSGTGGRELELFQNTPGGNNYEVYYSPDSGQVFVIWINT